MGSITKHLTICVTCFTILFCACSRDTADLIESTGTIEATEVDIRTEAAGIIRSLYFDEGDWVEQGAVLAEIDREKKEIELAQAKARLSETEAQLTLLIKGLRDKEVERVWETFLESGVLSKTVNGSTNAYKSFLMKGLSISDHGTRRKPFTRQLKNGM